MIQVIPKVTTKKRCQTCTFLILKTYFSQLLITFLKCNNIKLMGIKDQPPTIFLLSNSLNTTQIPLINNNTLIPLIHLLLCHKLNITNINSSSNQTNRHYSTKVRISISYNSSNNYSNNKLVII